MSDDILELFEGLTSEQVRELRSRIVPTLERLRNEITKGEQTMTQEFKLTEAEIAQVLAARQKQTTPDEEQQIVDRAAAQAKQEIEQLRTGRSQEALQAAYVRERDALAASQGGRPGEQFIRQLSELRAKYRAQGLKV